MKYYVYLTVISACNLLFQPFAVASEDDWQFRFTPYGWIPSLSLDTSVGNSPPTSSETDILDVLDFAFLATAEARKGNWGVIGEFNYLALSDDASFVGGLVNAETEMKGVMGGVTLAYRFYDGPKTTVDALGGFRFWSIESEINFRVLPTVSASTEFVDPIIGLRGSYDVSDRVFLTGLADIGGFGVGSDFQWEIVGRAGYKFNDWIAAGIGYRHYDLHVDRDRIEIDASISGPFVALDFTW